jgi:hypothetical protein
MIDPYVKASPPLLFFVLLRSRSRENKSTTSLASQIANATVKTAEAARESNKASKNAIKSNPAKMGNKRKLKNCRNALESGFSIADIQM